MKKVLWSVLYLILVVVSGQTEGPLEDGPNCVHDIIEDGPIVAFNGTIMTELISEITDDRTSAQTFNFDVCYVSGGNSDEALTTAKENVHFVKLNCEVLMAEQDIRVETHFLETDTEEGLQDCFEKLGIPTGVTTELPVFVLEVVDENLEIIRGIYSTDKFRLRIRNILAVGDFKPPIVDKCWYNIEPKYGAGSQDKQWTVFMTRGCTKTTALTDRRIAFMPLEGQAKEALLQDSLSAKVLVDKSSETYMYTLEFRCKVYICNTDHDCKSGCLNRRGDFKVVKGVESFQPITSLTMEVRSINKRADDDILILRPPETTQYPTLQHQEEKQGAMDKIMPYFVLANLIVCGLLFLLLLYVTCCHGNNDNEPRPDYPTTDDEDGSQHKIVPLPRTGYKSPPVTSQVGKYTSSLALLSPVGDKSHISNTKLPHLVTLPNQGRVVVGGDYASPPARSRIPSSIDHHQQQHQQQHDQNYRLFVTPTPNRYQDGSQHADSAVYTNNLAATESSYLNQAHHEDFSQANPVLSPFAFNFRNI